MSVDNDKDKDIDMESTSELTETEKEGDDLMVVDADGTDVGATTPHPTRIRQLKDVEAEPFQSPIPKIREQGLKQKRVIYEFNDLDSQDKGELAETLKRGSKGKQGSSRVPTKVCLVLSVL